MKYQITDGGKKASGFTYEHNDCTVRAISIACGMTYEKAHSMLKQHGRRDGKACYNFSGFMDNNIKFIDRKYTDFKFKNSLCTLGKFLKDNPVGSFVLSKSGHAFAVVDGVVMDSWKPGPKSQIRGYWRIK